MSDIIFWYTGAAVWAVIGAAFAIIAVIVFIYGLGQAYHGGFKWALLTGFLRMTDEEKNVFNSAFARLTNDEQNAVRALIDKHKELLRLMPRGQRLDFDLSGIGGDQWWELNDGTKGRVVSCGSGDWLKHGDQSFRLRMENDQLIRVRHDGVVEDQPALRVIRTCAAPTKPS